MRNVGHYLLFYMTRFRCYTQVWACMLREPFAMHTPSPLFRLTNSVSRCAHLSRDSKSPGSVLESVFAVIEDDVPHEPKKLDPPNGPYMSARSLLPCHDSGLREVQERSTEYAMSSIFGVQLSISYTFANFRGRVFLYHRPTVRSPKA